MKNTMEDFLREIFSPQNLVVAIAAAWFLFRYLVKEFVTAKKDDQEHKQVTETLKLQASQLYTEQLTEATIEILKDNQDDLRHRLDAKLDEIISNQRITNSEISNQRTILNHLWRRVEQLRDELGKQNGEEIE